MNLKIFKIKKSFKKGGTFIEPSTSWKIVLCVTLVLIFASFVFGYNLFLKIDKGFVSPPSNLNTQIKIVKKERILEVLKYFIEREKKSAEILSSPAPIADPSL